MCTGTPLTPRFRYRVPAKNRERRAINVISKFRPKSQQPAIREMGEILISWNVVDGAMKDFSGNSVA